MKSILFVTPRFPLPAFKGDQTVCHHRMKCLSRDHRITLLSFYAHDSDLAGMDEVKRYCEAVHTVRLPRWRSAVNMAQALGQPQMPLQAAYYRSPQFAQLLRSLVDQGGYDVVHGFLLRMAPYMVGLPVPTVLELIDSMQLNLARRIDKTRGPKAWALQEELRRVSGYERALLHQVDALTVVSRVDQAQIGTDRLWAIPNGVDTTTFSPAPGPAAAPVVVFSGNMGYEPNALAVQWFVNHCFPYVRACVPDARFVIAGIDPTPAVQALASVPGVEVTGFVESMATVLAGAQVAVAPMISGSGMQNKILEAMACGLPVVTTPIGRGDIAARNGHELLVALQAEDFAGRVVDLLRDPDAARAMGLAARAYVLERHSWNQAADSIRKIYAALTPEARTA